MCEVAIGRQDPQFLFDGVGEDPPGTIAALRFVPGGTQRIVVSRRPRALEPAPGGAIDAIVASLVGATVRAA